jgi:hypothetical protein
MIGSPNATGTSPGLDHIKRVTAPTSDFNSLIAALLFPEASAVVIA